MARYDGLAEWYDGQITGPLAAYNSVAYATLHRLVGPGEGCCLDLCCGTGINLAPFSDLGWEVIGVDESSDQLRVARKRAPDAELVQADATALPFDKCSFDVVAAAFVHTDVADFTSVVAEAARVLRSGGRMVHVGTHPCFTGPFAELREDGRRLIHTGYRDTRRTTEGIGLRPGGIRSTVGMRHVPLAELLQSFTAADLVIEQAEEPGEGDPPVFLAICARKP
jgi:SAM-dependent methyltransferase